ncbi:MAG: oligosaccharide flippase family protein [Bacilli bacterium]
MLNKLKSNKFFISTLILLVGGSFSKFLGFILKIIVTRYIGTEGIGLYSIISPTYSLFTVTAILSFPIAISALVSTPKRSSKKLIFSIIPVSLILNIIVIFIIFLISPILSNNLLHEPRLYYPILSIALTLPFVGLSSIIKGYFWGKQRMIPYITSNIVEQIVRIILLVIFIPLVLRISLIYTICLIIAVNVISETSSIIVMLLFLPKGVSITYEDLKPSKRDIKDILSICIPSTSSKIVSSITYFLEPIILTSTLLFVGYSPSFIINEYGILNGYAFAILLLPHFFSISISTVLIPEVSSLYSQGKINKCKKRIKQIVILSFIIGLISSTILFIFPTYFLKLIYNTTEGSSYVRVLAFVVVFYFIDTPIVNAMQALNKSKESMYTTLVCSSIRLVLIFLLSLLKIGLYGVVIATSINIIVSTILNIRCIKKTFK